jgi:hypothetical protein
MVCDGRALVDTSLSPGRAPSSASIQALPHARMFREAMNRAVSPAKARLMRYPTAEAVN